MRRAALQRQFVPGVNIRQLFLVGGSEPCGQRHEGIDFHGLRFGPEVSEQGGKRGATGGWGWARSGVERAGGYWLGERGECRTIGRLGRGGGRGGGGWACLTADDDAADGAKQAG